MEILIYIMHSCKEKNIYCLKYIMKNKLKIDIYLIIINWL